MVLYLKTLKTHKLSQMFIFLLWKHFKLFKSLKYFVNSDIRSLQCHLLGIRLTQTMTVLLQSDKIVDRFKRAGAVPVED